MTVEKTPGERPVPVRRDARRNRDLLIAAAREAFAAQGLDAPLDDIARRAGVGNATLYRHFPVARRWWTRCSRARSPTP